MACLCPAMLWLLLPTPGGGHSMLKGVYLGRSACLLPPPSPSHVLKEPELRGPPPGLSRAGPPARGAYRGGERLRQGLHHVLWAAGSGPCAGAANRGAGPPEAPPGAPQARSAHCPGSGSRGAWAGAAAVGGRGSSLPSRALLWTVPGGPSLALPCPQPPRQPVFRTQRRPQCCFLLLPALPLTPLQPRPPL